MLREGGAGLTAGFQLRGLELGSLDSKEKKQQLAMKSVNVYGATVIGTRHQITLKTKK